MTKGEVNTLRIQMSLGSQSGQQAVMLDHSPPSQAVFKSAWVNQNFVPVFDPGEYVLFHFLKYSGWAFGNKMRIPACLKFLFCS